MNNDKIKGTTRKLGGDVEEEFGKLVGSNDMRGDGIVDQVVGAAQNALGDVKEVAATAYDRASPTVREGAERAVAITRENSVLAILVAGAVGYALSWAFHGRDDRDDRKDRSTRKQKSG